tara:strand:+ start:8015 stop:8869 length:855 start_codon:yes stop_codon:yes gene_type:complete
MRFITFSSDKGQGVAIRAGDFYHGCTVAELGRDLKAALQSPDAVQDLARDLSMSPKISLDEVELLPPIPAPDKIICIGLNYRDHAEESGFEIPAYPTVFSRYANSLVAHGAPLVRPNASDMLDYEAELAVIIGKSGRHISKDKALEHVAGYSVFNDGSVRDFQMKSPQWTMGKTFDATGGFGPELVTPEELPEGCNGLKLTMQVNGEVLQSASTNDFIFDVATLISTLSEAMTLTPGDVIVTGTPGGVGALRKPPIWLKPGDECVVEIEKIGKLVNPVIQESKA